tara:strand:- start:377 stop:2065 length:1689 start_codon:yes stop_codon:yes gene_type:complete
MENLEARYEAISYTWGEPRLEYSLTVDDGTHVLVTRNLDLALRIFRHQTKERVLWADAVCINQIDNDEKAHQIPLMTHIFRNAHRVLAWLDGGIEEEYGCQLLDRFSRVTREEINAVRDNTARETHPSEAVEQQRQDEHLILRFLSLPWFSRLWIIQEVVMNVEVLLVCGSSELSWPRLTTALTTIQKTAPQTAERIGPGRIEALQHIAWLWKYHAMMLDGPQHGNGSPKRHQDILTILNTFWRYQCTDPRDRLYALCSMASDIQASQPSALAMQGPISRRKICMEIDYALDVRQTYQRFAMACVSSRRTMEILNSVLARQYSVTSDDWPSWVPDWREVPSEDHVDIARIMASTLVLPDRIQLYLPSLRLLRRSGVLVVDERIAAGETLDCCLSSLHQLSVAKPAAQVWSRLICALKPGLGISMEEGDSGHAITENLRRLDSSHARLTVRELKEMTEALRAAIKPQVMFVVTTHDSRAHFIGVGNPKIISGDHLIALEPGAWDRSSPTCAIHTLLLRPQHRRAADTRSHMTSYRLVGSASIIHVSTLTYTGNQRAPRTITLE